MMKRAHGLLVQTGPYSGLHHQCLLYFKDRGRDKKTVPESRKTRGDDYGENYVIVKIHFNYILAGDF